MRVISIDGKEYPAAEKYSAIKMFCDKKGIDFFEFPTLLESYKIGDKKFKPTAAFLDDMAEIAVCFIERGIEKSNSQLRIEKNDVLDWILEGNLDIVIEMINNAHGFSKNVEAPVKQVQQTEKV